MADMEAPAVVDKSEANTPEEPTQENQTSVGVLGWLGFIIINSAAWGMITLSSSINWIFGFVICLIYTLGLIGLALWLERKGQKYRQFQNLLWVLGCWFVLILGVYFSVHVIGDVDSSNSNSGGIAPIPGDGQLANLLPANASADLQSWAKEDDWTAARNPTFAAFNSNIFFSGAEGTDSTQRLMRSSGSSLSKVTPSLRDANSFLEYQSGLFFAARQEGVSEQEDGVSGQELWRVDSSNLSTATLVTSSGGQVRHLFVDVVSNKLYFKGGYQCPNTVQYVWVETIFRTDGTTEGTEDLRKFPCASISNLDESGDVNIGGHGKPAIGVLWGVLFLGDLPMMALASFAFHRKKMPGLFVNLFGGVYCAAIVVYLLIHYNTSDLSGVNLFSFMKWFTTIFTSVLWFGIVAVSLLMQDLSEWQDELKSWAVAVVGVSFFVIIHIDLGIPFQQDWWRWVTYAALTIAQMVVSMVVSRSVPMVAGAAGTFVIAWKVASEIVQLAGIEGPFAMLTMLAIFALQGVGIILLAIYYAGRRTAIDDMVRQVFRCSKSHRTAIDDMVRQVFRCRKSQTATPAGTDVMDVTK